MSLILECIRYMNSTSLTAQLNRLLQCGLSRLETRRLRGDQTELFQIANDYEDVDRNVFFKLNEGSRIRGYKAVLVKE